MAFLGSRDERFALKLKVLEMRTDLVQRFGVDSRRTWWPFSFRAGTRDRACDSKIGAGREAIRNCGSGQICTLFGFGFVVPEASPGL
jgi:hypothetical protein